MEEIIDILKDMSSSGSPLTIKTKHQGEKIMVQIRLLDGNELSTINLGSSHSSIESALRYSAFTLVQMERGGFNVDFVSLPLPPRYVCAAVGQSAHAQILAYIMQNVEGDHDHLSYIARRAMRNRYRLPPLVSGSSPLYLAGAAAFIADAMKLGVVLARYPVCVGPQRPDDVGASHLCEEAGGVLDSRKELDHGPLDVELLVLLLKSMTPEEQLGMHFGLLSHLLHATWWGSLLTESGEWLPVAPNVSVRCIPCHREVQSGDWRCQLAQLFPDEWGVWHSLTKEVLLASPKGAAYLSAAAVDYLTKTNALYKRGPWKPTSTSSGALFLEDPPPSP